jgi:stress response protein YsnF
MQAEQYRGQTLVASDGEKIGTIEDVYIDNATQQPEWAVVTTGLFGSKQTFVPLTRASEDQGKVVVPFNKSQVKDAPSVDADGDLDEAEEMRLAQHYGLGYSHNPSPTGMPVDGGSGGPATQTQGNGNSGQGVELHEERLDVGTVRRPSELVRLRKYVVTENVTKTVPVQHEEVRIERTPIEGGAAGEHQIAQGEEVTEVQLNSEEPMIRKDVVATERVNLNKEVTTEQRSVEGQVRREQVDVQRNPGS